MTGYPVLVQGDVRAVVVGGGPVAARKARAMLEGGLSVRVIASHVSADLRALAAAGARCVVEERPYAAGDLAGAHLVVAATDDPLINARVAADARAAAQLVNVADAPLAGSFVTPAVHRSGALVIAVSGGGVPRAAARIRDAIAARFDARYAAALGALAALRARCLGGAGRESWRRAESTLVGDDFCARVESGTLANEVAAWR